MAGYEHVQRLHDSPPEPEFALRGHLAAISCVRFVAAGDQQLVASGDTSGVAKLWSLSARRPVASWSASDQGVLETHEHAGGESLLTQHRDGRIRLWDLDRLGGGAKPEDALARTLFTDSYFFTRCAVAAGAGKGRDIPNFSLGRFPPVSADFWTSEPEFALRGHLAMISRSVNVFFPERARAERSR